MVLAVVLPRVVGGGTTVSVMASATAAVISAAKEPTWNRNMHAWVIKFSHSKYSYYNPFFLNFITY